MSLLPAAGLPKQSLGDEELDEEEIKDQPKTKVYTDGGLKSPDRKWWSLGGFGIWWPRVGEGEETNWRAQETLEKYMVIDINPTAINKKIRS